MPLASKATFQLSDIVKRIEPNKDIYYSNCSGVFQGGGCKAIAYIGAYEVANEHGVMFSELAGTSAGSIIAAAIALGATPEQIKSFVSNLDFLSLLKVTNIEYPQKSIKDQFNIRQKGPAEWLFWHFCEPAARKKLYQKLKNSESQFWKNFDHTRLFNEYGIFDSNNLSSNLRDWFSKISGRDDPKFKDLSVDLKVLASDIPRHTAIVFSKKNSPDKSIAEAVTASCSIPVFFTPPDKRYIDGGILSNRPDVFIENRTNYLRSLSFSLIGNDSHIGDFMEFMWSIVDTVIQGADEIQHEKIATDKIEILCDGINATDFSKINPASIDRLIENGRQAMNTFFLKLRDKTDNLATTHIHLNSIEQVYSQVAYWGYERIDEITVSMQSLDWVWRLFPTIVKWCENGSRLKVFYGDVSIPKKKRSIINGYEQNGKSASEAEVLYNKLLDKQSAIIRFLNEIGASIEKSTGDYPDGFYFKMGLKCKAVIFKTMKGIFDGKVYSDDLDNFALQSLLKSKHKSGLKKIVVTTGKETDTEESLKKIPMYADAGFRWVDVDVTSLRFLNVFIRGEKYKQIYNMFNLYPNDVELFSAISLRLGGGHESLVGPIVVEEHNGNLFVIEGNTRALFAYKHNIPKLKVLVVKGVQTPLPLDMQLYPKGYSIDQVRISEIGLEGKERYTDFDYSLFRPIEQALRPNAQYLL